MKAYKLEILIIDHDNVGKDGIQDVIENVHYPNRCISPRVFDIQAKDIGEWSDDHPLNKYETMVKYYVKLFGEK